MQKEAKVFVVGHKNPDTDSICSAIAYAYLKNSMKEEREFLACRAGDINDETRFVLNYFQMEDPILIEDVRTQVKDIEISKTEGVSRDISLKKAWRMMKEQGVVTLPITLRNHLQGLITVNDITASFMESYDNRVLSQAHTRYRNIIETLEGTVITGDERAYFTKGKVLIAAANPDLMESYIEENDLVLLGNRYESQLCAIEMGAACIVVCDGARVSLTIRKLAMERGCTIISTPFDTFTAARFINQSMPISYYMKRDNLVTFEESDYIDDIEDTMANQRHRDFPILDDERHYVGMISRRNLLKARKKQVIMVDHNEAKQAVKGIEDAEILEILDHHRLGTIETMAPVYFRCQPLGCTATIVYQMYQEAGVEVPKEMAGLLCSAIISDTLLFRSPTCTAVDKIAAIALGKIAGLEIESYAKEMFSSGSNLKHKTAEQIFFQDYKRFSLDETEVGVGQISSMNADELKEIEENMMAYMKKAILAQGIDMVFIMLTSILDESTRLLCWGDKVEQVVEYAFGVKLGVDGIAELPGVVSRKKQLIPSLMSGIQIWKQ